MHRTFGYLSKRFVQVRRGEGRKVVLTFLYFFLIITAYYLIKPVSRSLVLGELGSRVVPYADLVCAILMGPLVALFAKLVDRVQKPALVSGSFWVVIAVLLGFWQLLSLDQPWVAGVFYIWVAIFSVLVVTLFWLVANDLYRPREAKRLFGFIGSGGILGGIVGSSIAAVGAQVIGTERLLLVSSGVLLCCWVVVQQLWKLAPDRTQREADAAETAAKADSSKAKGLAKHLLQSRYLLLLVAVVGLSKLIGTLVYYQFNPFIEQAFPDQDAKTTFTGIFNGTMNLFAFVVQFFFTSWVLRRWGLFVALLTLPIGLVAGTAGLFFFPVFWLAAATEMYDRSLSYSLQQTTKEVLYLPIDRSIRYKVKPFIDMVVFRFGKGIAAIIGIIMLDVLGVPVWYLSLIAVPLTIGWIAASVQLRRDYVTRIRTMLQARAAAGRETPMSLESEGLKSGDGAARALTDQEMFGSLTNGRTAERKLELIDELLSTQESRSLYAKELLEELAAQERRLDDIKELQVGNQQLRRIISDPNALMAQRCLAIRNLARFPDQATVDYLFGVELVDADASLRHEALRGLVKLRLRDQGLDFPTNSVRRQVVREVTNYQHIVHVAEIYRQHHAGPVAADDPVLGLLRVLLEETVEQIFRLLMLLYHPEDIHLVYEQIRVSEAYLRADAVELLDNLVDPAMRQVIAPILDEDRFLSLIDQHELVEHAPAAAHQLLQGAIWDHNSWLSVTTLCAVGRLRLATMQQELERATRHTVPLVSKAARVALDLAGMR